MSYIIDTEWVLSKVKTVFMLWIYRKPIPQLRNSCLALHFKTPKIIRSYIQYFDINVGSQWSTATIKEQSCYNNNKTERFYTLLPGVSKIHKFKITYLCFENPQITNFCVIC